MSVRILVIRLGATGDIIHALPAVASLKQSFPHSKLVWAVEARWRPLLDGNPFIDQIVDVERHSLRGLLAARRTLRALHCDFAVDFQGLIKSALIASGARPERIYGLHRSEVREKPAALVYSHPVRTGATHVVDKNLSIAQAAGASNTVRGFWIPTGKPEAPLPDRFVLASPHAGWAGKQWPLEHYRELGRRLPAELGIDLVLDDGRERSIAGLIDATRRAAAVVGVDSGPLHLAAALGKPGVAIFGPTDPARNGPYCDTIEVLRDPAAETTYKRANVVSESMKRITVDAVFAALTRRM